ncbi:hypothetical protein F4780DRAFT_397531 [Xylariomycetidae sp. FL0641]|nr:hypothetical protein F4780DRAFT_397531 [Xylariomycetidae sp. FL0641]
MACPAGHGGMTSTGDHQPAKPSLYRKPHIFNTIAEPKRLREITNDAIYLLGGQFAIICQFAHPGLAEGSYKHSNFAYRIMNRLQTTARFLNAAVYGTTEEKQAIFSVIHHAHEEVKGENYYADDPELHKWTAATLFVSLIVVHETFFGKVSREKQEELFRESAVYGTSLRMPPEMWPATLDDFWAYWDRNIQSLQITGWARSLARNRLWPKNMPLWARPNMPIARLLTVHWLPERFQREFGLKVTPLNTAMYHFVVGYTALLYPRLPKRVRTYPSRMYMKDLKKAVKQIEETGSWSQEKKA